MQKIPNSALGRLSPEAFAATEKYPVVVVLDNIRSLNNVGSFFRTCDAFAMERIVLCGITATPPNKEIHKTALGAELTVRWDYEKLTTDALQQLRGEGYTLLAVEQVEKAARLTTFEVEKGKKYVSIFVGAVLWLAGARIGGHEQVSDRYWWVRHYDKRCRRNQHRHS